MLKSLLVINSFYTGGAERASIDLYEYLNNNGVDVLIVKLSDAVLEHEINSLDIRYKVKVLKSISRKKKLLELKNIIDEYQPNIVHAVLFDASLYCRIVKTSCSHKFSLVESLVNTTYDPIRLLDPNINWLKLKAYQLLDAATAHLFSNHFHAITETVGQHHQKAWWMPSKRITVIPRGRMPNVHRGNGALRAHYQEELAFDPQDFIIITTGRQEFQKGHAHLLRALYLVRERGLHKFKYIMLGRQGHATPEINRLINEMQLASHIIQLGHRQDVEQILPIGHVFAFPSVYEGLGVSLIEAQAAGLPLLCNDIPVFREVTRPGENAWLIPATDTAAWADALLRLSESVEIREKMGAISLQHFNDNYQLDVVHKRMMEFFIQQTRS